MILDRIKKHWELIEADPGGSRFLESGRQESIRLGAHIEDEFGLIKKVTNPTQSNWFVSHISCNELDYVFDRYIPRDLDCCLEIGLFMAGTHILLKSVSKKVVSVDVSWSNIMCSAGLLRYFGLDANSHLIWGDSKEQSTLDFVKKEVGDEVDLLIVDGDHSIGAAYSDLCFYTPLVKPGGWVIVDDILSEQVFFALRQFSIDYGVTDIKVIYAKEHGQGIAIFQIKEEFHEHE